MELVDLRAILAAHKRWLRNERGGRRADFTLKTFRGLDLRKAELTRAKLTGAPIAGTPISAARIFRAPTSPTPG